MRNIRYSVLGVSHASIQPPIAMLPNIQPDLAVTQPAYRDFFDSLAIFFVRDLETSWLIELTKERLYAQLGATRHKQLKRPRYTASMRGYSAVLSGLGKIGSCAAGNKTRLPIRTDWLTG